MKTPSKKTLMIIGGLILAIFILRMLKSRYDNSGSEEKNKVSTSSTSSVSGSGNASPTQALKSDCDKNTVLSRGQKSTCVLYAQKQFNRFPAKIGISKLTEDGIFGSKTEAAFTSLLGKKKATYTEVVKAVNNL